MSNGLIEIITTDFVIGWAAKNGGHSAFVCARLGDKAIGVAKADLWQSDLSVAGIEMGRAFCLLFDEPIGENDLDKVEVRLQHNFNPLDRAAKLRVERTQPLQIFVLGSPRSGTSELAATLSRHFNLPWLGEAHAAASFATAAKALSGDIASPHNILNFMATQSFRQVAIDAMRRAYYFVHASASFIDKTPGVPMIEAAPFLHDAFPAARFIYLRRNGISNVLSRLVKFGGAFNEHCRDWIEAMASWERIKMSLPHYLEIEQEIMLRQPELTAGLIARYLGFPDAAAGIGASLRQGTAERTGAGIDHETLESTGWNPEQVRLFRKICGATMLHYGYSMD